MTRHVGVGRPTRPAVTLIAGALCAAFALAACGQGQSATVESGSSSEPSAASASDATLPTGLEPVPLAEPTTISVSIGSKSELVAAYLLADALGEFAKENLTIDPQIIPGSSDSIQALALGQLDVASAAVGAKAVNAALAGNDVRLVFPGPTRNPADGLYVWIDEETGQPKKIERIATPGGSAGVYIVPIARYLESVGQDISDVTIDMVAPADMPAALESEAYDAAWVNAPITHVLDSSDKYLRVVEYQDGEYGLGYLFGPNLLRDRPEVGQAFVRAMARTARDYLSGDYKQNAETVAKLAEVLESTPEDVASTQAMTFGLELPTDAIQQGQDLWLQLGGLLESDTPVAPDVYSDPSFVQRAASGA